MTPGAPLLLAEQLEVDSGKVYLNLEKASHVCAKTTMNANLNEGADDDDDDDDDAMPSF